VKGDPINKIGYKNGLITGLSIAGFGCLLFYPAAITNNYWTFLFALFTLGGGVTLIQIAANPYVSLLGDAESAPSRLNLSQGLNSLGTVLAPIIGGLLLFGTATQSSGSLKFTYLGLAAGFFLLAFLTKVITLPEFKNEEDNTDKQNLFQHKNFVFGTFAIFFYVGSEVTIGSILINYLGLESVAGLSVHQADKFLAFYWGGLMIGRFAGAMAFSDRDITSKFFTMTFMAAAAFAVIFGSVNFKAYMAGDELVSLYSVLPYLAMMILSFGFFFLAQGKPGQTIGMFSLVAVAFTILAIYGSGSVAMWAIIGIGLFNSIMWSNIFTLSINGLGKATSRGSSLLVMMVVGGAVMPAIQGALTDSIGLRPSLYIVVLGYLYLAFFGFFGSQRRELAASSETQKGQAHAH
jgi:FHS family L-fucose permease-like MFS transporter